MATLKINPDFAAVLGSFGMGAGDFFLAAGLYLAGKISFGAAVALDGLGYEEFHYRLKEHFGHGFIINDETARQDLRLGAVPTETEHLLRSPANARSNRRTPTGRQRPTESARRR
jgi:hypothetical protein